jgi:hypothetical protein
MLIDRVIRHVLFWSFCLGVPAYTLYTFYITGAF